MAIAKINPPARIPRAWGCRNALLLFSLFCVLFTLGNGLLSLSNPDEVFYAQTAKEMIQQKSWLVPYLFGQPQFEKPIFIYWLVRIAFIFFGVSNFGARFFPAFFAAIGVAAVYLLSLVGFGNEKKAFLCAIILGSCAVYIGMAVTLFTDMVFSTFILLALTSFYWGYDKAGKKGAGILLFFIFSALAVLTKGPLGLFVPLAIVALFLGIRKDFKFLFSKYTALGLLLFLLLALPWYLFMVKKFGQGFTHEFFYNSHLRRFLEAEHRENDAWYFYPASVILGIAPWSIYGVVSIFYFFRQIRQDKENRLYLFLILWMSVVFLVFQFAHSKLVSYILPLFAPLAIITGDFLCHWFHSRKDSKTIFILILITWLSLALLPVAVIINASIYSQYLPSKAPVYSFLLLQVPFVLILLFYILKRRFAVNIYLTALQVPLLVFFALSAHRDFDAYVSSRRVCEYLLKNYKPDNALLCSKAFVRGVRYYSDKEVVVFDMNGSGFFSPHPVPFFTKYREAKDFFQRQSQTYCIINKSCLADVRYVAEQFNLQLDILKQVGDAFIVLVSAQ